MQRKITGEAARLSAVLLPAIALFNAMPTLAVSLDWESLAQRGEWTNGQTSGTFLLDEDTGLSVDIDILAGEDTSFVSFGGGNATPAVNSIVNGSAGDDERSLHIQVDPKRVGTPVDSSFVNFAADFSDAVSDLNFSIFDIDISEVGAWQDRVLVKGYKDGVLVTPTFAAMVEAAAFAVADTFMLDGVSVAGNDSDTGTVRVSFDGLVDRVEIAYGSGSDVDVSDPENHGIGIGNFTAVVPSPEPTPIADVPEPSSLAGLLGLGFTVLAARKAKRKHD